MAIRVFLAWLAVVAALLAGYLLRPTPPVAERESRNGALLPEVELVEPQPAPLIVEEPVDAQPIWLTEGSEPVPAPLPQVEPDGDPVVPAQRLLLERPPLKRGTIGAP